MSYLLNGYENILILQSYIARLICWIIGQSYVFVAFDYSKFSPNLLCKEFTDPQMHRSPLLL